MSEPVRKLLRQNGIDDSIVQILVGQTNRHALHHFLGTAFRQLRDSISATLTFTSSAISGDVKALYVAVYQE
jgi:hypothetical protein